MNKNVLSIIKKNSFIIMIAVVLVVLSIVIIPAFVAVPKHVLIEGAQEGYVESVDEVNFDEVYAGNYPNVTTFESQTLDQIGIDMLDRNLCGHEGRYIVNRTDDINAPRFSYDALVYNNFSDQEVYNALYDYTFRVNYTKYDNGYSVGAGLYPTSNKKCLMYSNGFGFDYFYNDYKVFKITINPEVYIDEEILDNANMIFEDMDIEAERAKTQAYWESKLDN